MAYGHMWCELLYYVIFFGTRDIVERICRVSCQDTISPIGRDGAQRHR